MPILTTEQKNDLRLRVLRNEPITLEEARDVIESLRQGSAIAALASTSKAKGKKKPGISDEDFDNDLASLGL